MRECLNGRQKLRTPINIGDNSAHAADVDDGALGLDQEPVELMDHSHRAKDVDGEHFFCFIYIGIDGCHGITCPVALLV